MDIAEISASFLAACCSSHSQENLAELLLNSCQNLGLDCSFQFRSQLENSLFSTHNEISPLEKSLFTQTMNAEHFFGFNDKLMISFPHVELLFKNMPMADSPQYNALKGLMEVIGLGVNSRIKSLLNEWLLDRQYERTLDALKFHLNDFAQHAESIQGKQSENIQKHLTELENDDSRLGLNNSQIEQIKSMNIEFLARNEAISSAEMTIEEKIIALEKTLKKLTN
ncbi:hypothetical protein [sulfur-oxidizing endosymbiont of Gigantopelta aegis]|uniref:hypothetical protein n=1 Tax=sulfur-oxidizing endosymbiont of Gigantopelta aegis TaxID=2794934 RepID=UPI0018DD2DB0|nr:hypothetical protein [sulfur-oxidizing endosymbiont of Gigantopelta aegis]